MLLEREIELTAPERRPLAGPFPNLKTREVVLALVTAIAETLTHARFTESEQHAFALGMIRAGRTMAVQYGDDVAAPYLADLLHTLNHKGVAAVRELVEVVTGREIREGYVPGTNYEGTPFGLGNDDDGDETKARAA